MGEEMKKTEEEVKKSEETSSSIETKKGEVEESAVQEIVLKVDMHCEACARKVIRALHGFQGVEEVTADSKASKVVVKGKTADPLKLCQRIQSKSRRKAEIISPLPIPPDQQPQPQPHPPKVEEEQQPKKELQPALAAAAVVTVVVLSVRMHCEACAQGLRKRIRKIPGVEAVTTDLIRDQVTVKGVIDPDKIADDVYKKTGKHVSIVKEEKKKDEDGKKEEEKKEEEEEGEKKKEGEECRGETEDEKKNEIKKIEYLPSRYYTDYAFAYPSQMFSDENPNACSVM